MNNPRKKLLAAAELLLLFWTGCRNVTEVAPPPAETVSEPAYEETEAAETTCDDEEIFPEEIFEAAATEEFGADLPVPPAASALEVSFRTPARIAPGDSVSAEASVFNSGTEHFNGAAEWEIFHNGNLIDRFGVMLEAAPEKKTSVFIPIPGAGIGVLTLTVVVRDRRGAALASGSADIDCRDEEISLPPPAAATVSQSVFILSDSPEDPEIPAENLAEVPFGRELELIYTVDGHGASLPPGRLETGEFPGGNAYASEFPGGSGIAVVIRRLTPEFQGCYSLPEAVVTFSDGTGASCPGITLRISGPVY